MQNIHSISGRVIGAALALLVLALLPLIVEIIVEKEEYDEFMRLREQGAKYEVYEQLLGRPFRRYSLGEDDCSEFLMGLYSKVVVCCGAEGDVVASSVESADIQLTPTSGLKAIGRLYERFYERYIN